MNTLISKFDNRIFVQCDCGCSLISLFKINDIVYLQYFGYSEDNQTDFIFNIKDFNNFIISLELATNAIYEDYFTDYDKNNILEEREINYFDDKNLKEVISITADNMGCINIAKYHKKYKKFIKMHKKENYTCTNYKKCKCDWGIILEHTEAQQFLSAVKEFREEFYNE